METSVLKKLHDEEVKILDEIVRICSNNNLEYFLIGGTLLGAIRHKGFIPWDDDLDIAMPREDYEKFLKIAEQQLKEPYKLEYYKNRKRYYNVFAKVKNVNTIYEEKELRDYDGSRGIWVDIFPLDNSNKDSGIIWKIKGKSTDILKRMANMKYGTYDRDNIIKIIFKGFVYHFVPRAFIMYLANKIMQSNKNKKSKYFINYGSQYGIKKQTHLKENYLPTGQAKFEGKQYNIPRDFDYVLQKIYGPNYMQLPPEEKRITHNPIRIVFEDGKEVVFDE